MCLLFSNCITYYYVLFGRPELIIVFHYLFTGLLGIALSKIRVVNIVSSSSRRRKRAADDDSLEVTFEIGDGPAESEFPPFLLENLFN